MFTTNPIASPPMVAPLDTILTGKGKLNLYELGFNSLDGHMLFLADRASNYYRHLARKNQVAKEGQGCLQEVNEAIDKYRGRKRFISKDNISFLEEHFSELANWGSSDNKSLAELQEVKDLLDDLVLKGDECLKEVTEKAEGTGSMSLSQETLKFIKKYKVTYMPERFEHIGWRHDLAGLQDSMKSFIANLPKYSSEFSKEIEDYPNGTVKFSAGAITFFNKHLTRTTWGNWDCNSMNKLQEIHGLVDDFVSSQVDFVSESQLQVQRMMQSYNTAVTFMNSLQTSLAEMLKILIQGIR